MAKSWNPLACIPSSKSIADRIVHEEVERDALIGKLKILLEVAEKIESIDAAKVRIENNRRRRPT